MSGAFGSLMLYIDKYMINLIYKRRSKNGKYQVWVGLA
jgi:hypothetical protein